jgi:hypothetical protein
MKNIFKACFCVSLCFCCCFNAKAQNVNDKQIKEANLFEYGEPLASSEVNFKNLFTNFPKLVKNADAVDLLSYKFVGAIETRKQARDFLKKNIYPNAPGWSVTVSNDESGDSFPQTQIWLDFSATVGANQAELDEAIKTICEKYVTTGSEVYEVEFACQLKAYKYYVFVDAQTKQVVTEGNIFGFRFPVSGKIN